MAGPSNPQQPDGPNLQYGPQNSAEVADYLKRRFLQRMTARQVLSRAASLYRGRINAGHIDHIPNIRFLPFLQAY